MMCQFINFSLPHFERCVTVIKYGNLNSSWYRAGRRRIGHDLAARLISVPQG